MEENKRFNIWKFKKYKLAKYKSIGLFKLFNINKKTLRYYDEIVEKAFQKAQVTLTTHQRLLRNYEQVYKNFTK